MKTFHPVPSASCLLLMLALIGTVKAPLVNAQPAITSTVAQASEVAETDSIKNQLLGQWQARDPETDELVTFIFTPEARLLIVLPDKEGSAIAIQMGYEIDVTTQPMQLEVIANPEEVAQTIFELTDEGKLRLELDGIDPGQPRPTAFSSSATLFEKISDSTILPEDLQVVELETEKSRPNIPTQFITILTQAQQAYYLENGKFAADVAELGIVTNLETEFYSYEIVPQGDSHGSAIGELLTHSVAVIALPKPDTELPSYIGWLFITKIEGETTAIRRICKSEESSIDLSLMPTIVLGDSLEILCPAGFSLLR
ncbi:MAG: hypothetical protein F6K47_34115 [Symploca sp. SIO2E6]|nr:hypothetical protein [Symploca sp. SIO2E6]